MSRRLLSLLPWRPRVPGPVQLHFTRTPPVASIAHPPPPPVVMVHGVLASESTYRSTMKRPDFVPTREKIGVDLRNHGKSPHLHPQEKMTYHTMTSDLATFLDHHQIEKACLIGHSMGGKVAMNLALSHPSRVSELVVVDIAPIDYTTAMHSSDSLIATRAMRAVDLRQATSRAHVDDQLKSNGVDQQSVRQFVMTNLVPETDPKADTTYRWKVNLEAIETSLPEIMTFPDHQGRTFDGPTCLIRGGKSKYVPFQSMRVFTSLFPNTKLVTISDAGHWLQAQEPDQFCRSVNDFLND